MSISNLKKTILCHAERLLSLEDRNISSPTYGCFDRDFWAWKFKDIQDSCMQNGVYALALLWNNNFEGNIYFKNDNLREWIITGLKQWCRIQHRNGSFDQIFPNEYSYGATAFTLFYMLETYEIVGSSFSDDFKKEFLATVKKAADFIVKSKEKHDFISNHLFGASAALYNYYLISKDNKYKQKAKDILSFVFQNQDEGWLVEYGGADPGYQTLALYYLAKYYLKSNDKAILSKIKKLGEFLSYFTSPDSSIGGAYGSRNTEMLYPAGFALLSNQIQLSQKIANLFCNNLSSEGMVSLNSTDDSNFIPVFISWIETLIAQDKTTSEQTPHSSTVILPFENNPFHKHFKKANLYIANTNKYYAILGISKNGLLKVFDKEKNQLTYNDYGYIAVTIRGKTLSTQYLNPNVQTTINGESQIDIRGSFSEISLPVPTPWKIFILRFLNLTICRNKTIGNLIKRVLVKKLIRRIHTSNLNLERSIKFSEHDIFINDTLSKPVSLQIVRLSRGTPHSTMHMATSGYFSKKQLKQPIPFSDFDIAKFNKESKVQISFKI